MKAEFSLKHLVRLTDKVGLLEHCIITTPDPKEGYSVDDNARALMICQQLTGEDKEEIKNLAPIYLNFLLKAMDDKGFHQDMNEDLIWKDDAGIHEGFGRAMLALAGTEYFNKLAHLIPTVKHSRVMAQLIVALAKRKSLNSRKELIVLADKLVGQYEKYADASWQWFEDILTYENSRFPFALFTAFEVTQNQKYLEVAKESLDFLIQYLYNFSEDCFSFTGNKGWSRKGNKSSVFGQQPVEAGGMVEVCCLAYKIIKEKKYLDFAHKAFEWYGGRNVKHLSLIDEESGGIKDGLESYGVNQNEGAESILSYILACLALRMLE